jgi:HPr kinase/phosphorylase
VTPHDPPIAEQGISVGSLFGDSALRLSVTVVAGQAGLSREIRHPRIQKSGLAMVGHLHGLVPTRIQVLGETELSYVESLNEEEQRQAAGHLFSLTLACVLVTRGAMPPHTFIEEAERTNTPLVVCSERSSVVITAIHALLDERLAPRKRIHGVLVDVFEVGVLMLGKSGIGKSETALELVMRGHRLVADDIVECDYRPPGMIFAEPAELLRHHIEVRGLGILDIKELFGVTAIRERKRIDLVVRLELLEDDGPVDRIGLEERTFDILGIPIREMFVPVRPGRNTSAIIEIAARSELLRQAGHDSNREFIAKVDAHLRGETFSSRPAPRHTLATRDLDRTDDTQLWLESSIPPPIAPKGKA